MRRAKILATLGPVSRDPKLIEAMLAAGIDGVRVNMSHGTQDEKADDIRMARAAAVTARNDATSGSLIGFPRSAASASIFARRASRGERAACDLW